MSPVAAPAAHSVDTAVWRRAAILVDSLPETTARSLLSRLSADQRRQVRRAVATLADVDALERHRATQSFYQSMRQSVQQPTATPTPPSPPIPAVTLPPATLPPTTPPTTADQMPGETPVGPPAAIDSPLTFLQNVESGRLYRTLCTEHPQTVAVVLASLPPSTAASILQRMPEARRSEAIARIGRLGPLDETIAEEIAGTLRQKLPPVPTELPPTAVAPAAPNNRLSEILSQMPGRDAPTGPVPTGPVPPPAPPPGPVAVDPEPVVLPFEPPTPPPPDDAAIERQLTELPPLALCAALGQVDTTTAVRTLQGLPAATVKAALAALPRGVARGVRRQVAQVDGVSLRQIDEAKRQVATLADRPTAAAA